MKKIISIFLLLIILLSINACSFNNNETNNSSTNNDKNIIVENDDSICSFSYNNYNGEKTVDSFELKKDDVVDINIKNNKGKISASVKSEEDVEALWWGEDIKNGKYKLTSNQNGKYIITIVGKNASGNIKFIKREK